MDGFQFRLNFRCLPINKLKTNGQSPSSKMWLKDLVLLIPRFHSIFYILITYKGIL